MDPVLTVALRLPVETENPEASLGKSPDPLKDLPSALGLRANVSFALIVFFLQRSLYKRGRFTVTSKSIDPVVAPLAGTVTVIRFPALMVPLITMGEDRQGAGDVYAKERGAAAQEVAAGNAKAIDKQQETKTRIAIIFIDFIVEECILHGFSLAFILPSRP